MIEVSALTKRYGDTLAVDDLSFKVNPGVVTGFLGPNGAGKSTTMRMILGLDAQTSGAATVNGRSYRNSPAPMREVGALLDSEAIQGGRTAANHLKWMAQAGGVASHRVDEVLEMVGLIDVAGKKIGGFSLGMFQRLGIAGSLLGDPQTLLFDEPVNGLDPEGILWFRNLMKQLASEGRTILASSHLMSEMEEMADHILVIGQGRLIADMSIKELTERSSGTHVRVATSQKEEFAPLLKSNGATVNEGADDVLLVTGMESAAVSDLAAANSIRIHELTTQRASLESAFMELTRNSTEFHGSDGKSAEVAETVRAMTSEGADS